MGILSDLKNRLFQEETINTNVSNNAPTHLKRFSIGENRQHLLYQQGVNILQDTTVTMCYDILKYILSSKQYVLMGNNKDLDGTVYDFIEDMLFNMDTEVNEIVRREISALLWGFHLEELIFDINDEGKIYLKNMIPLDIKTLQYNPFTYNTNGELISIHQEYNGDSADIPINKILKYTFGDFDSDYGHGLLLDVKSLVEDKINIQNWLMTFLERHSLPTLVGKTNNPASRDAFLSAFEDIKDGTVGMTIGDTDDVFVLESSHHGETFFNSLAYADNQIVKRFYIGDLLMGSNTSTGSYARSNTQLEFSQLVFDGILEEIANCFQKQIINPIVEWNYGDVGLAPTFGFDKFTTGDINALFTTVKPLIDSGVVDSENKAVQDSIALMFKKETGLQYINDEEELNEDFTLPANGEDLTSNIIENMG